MYNLAWLIVLYISGVIAILLAWKFGGKTGLYVLTPIILIVSNIQVLMQIDVVGVTITTGGLFGLTFLVTDILNEHYNDVRVTRKAVWFGFAGMIVFTIFSQIQLAFQPSQLDWAFPHLESIFALMPRITFASLLAYLVSQTNDVYLFQKIRKQTGGKYLWLRNNLSTMTSGLIDAFTFVTVAFYGIFTNEVIIALILTGVARKYIEALADTPAMYISTKIKPKEI